MYVASFRLISKQRKTFIAVEISFFFDILIISKGALALGMFSE